MKLINYNYGYMDIFSCSIHGKITMTRRTWKKAITYLRRTSRRYSSSNPWFREMLENDIISPRVHTKDGSIIYNIRVPATERLVERYKLKGYKRANYMIEVKK